MKRKCSGATGLIRSYMRVNMSEALHTCLRAFATAATQYVAMRLTTTSVARRHCAIYLVLEPPGLIVARVRPPAQRDIPRYGYPTTRNAPGLGPARNRIGAGFGKQNRGSTTFGALCVPPIRPGKKRSLFLLLLLLRDPFSVSFSPSIPISLTGIPFSSPFSVHDACMPRRQCPLSEPPLGCSDVASLPS